MNNDKTKPEYELVREMLFEFFSGDGAKVNLWLATRNPLLGGMLPGELLAIRPGRLLKIVKEQLEENKPPKTVVSSEMKDLSKHRVAAEIANVRGPYDNEHGGWSTDIGLSFDNSYQALGGLHLDYDSAWAMVFEIMALFGVAGSNDLIGKRCFGLKSFAGYNEFFVGIETEDGKRWLLSDFVRRRFPDQGQKQDGELEERKTRLRERVARLHRDLRDAERELLEIDSKYHDWSNP